MGLTKAIVFQMLPVGKESECQHSWPVLTISRRALRPELTVAMAAERPNSDLCFRASPVGVADHDPLHRKVVSEVQVAFIREPGRPQFGYISILLLPQK